MLDILWLTCLGRSDKVLEHGFVHGLRQIKTDFYGLFLVFFFLLY